MTFPSIIFLVELRLLLSFPSDREAEIRWILMMIRDDVLQKLLSCGYPLRCFSRSSYPRKYGTVSTDEFVSFPSDREAGMR